MNLELIEFVKKFENYNLSTPTLGFEHGTFQQKEDVLTTELFNYN